MHAHAHADAALLFATLLQVDVDELDMDTFNRVMQWATSKTKVVSKTDS